MSLSLTKSLRLEEHWLENFLHIINSKRGRQKKDMLVQVGEDYGKQKRPKVTKISATPRAADSIPESYSFLDERPKVTKVTAKQKIRSGGGVDGLGYDYDFVFTINMHGHSGGLNIKINYSDYDPVNFSFLDVDSTETLLTDSKYSQTLLFGNLSTNYEGYPIDITVYMDSGVPREPLPVDHIKMIFEVVSPSFRERIGNFFRNLF